MISAAAGWKDDGGGMEDLEMDSGGDWRWMKS